MTTIGTTLLWCVIQVTAVATAAVAAYLLAFRGGASTRGGVALAGLVVAAALAPLAFSPWPRWEPSERDAGTPIVVTNPETTRSAIEDRTDERPAETERPEVGETASVWIAAWEGFVAGLTEPPAVPREVAETSETRPSFHWRIAVAWLFVAAVAAGLIRLAVGAWSVRRTIRRAKPIYEPTLFGLVDVLRAELSCTSAVELRESAEVATAATAGWRKPVVLLPPDWRDWTDAERRAVLAHELAHVKRRDYLAAIAAQAALAVHFYHPLLHWLAGRLRLEQELAADALAASVSGGRAAYLRTLAELALRRSDGRVAWPARAFLPSRRTFLRRIEMLRDPRKAVDRPAPLLRTATVAGLLVLGVAVAGFRPVTAQDEGSKSDVAAGGPIGETGAAGPDGTGISFGLPADPAALAAEEPAPGNPPAGMIAPVAYIPANAMWVVSLRPRALFGDPAVKLFATQIEDAINASPDPTWKTLHEAGVTPQTVESLAMGLFAREPGKSEVAVFALRLSQPIERGVLEARAAKKETTFGGIVYQLGTDAFVTVPDDRTVLLAPDEATLTAMLIGGQLNRSSSPWVQVEERLGTPILAVLLDADTIAAEIRKEFDRPGRPQNGPEAMMLAPIMPLLNDVDHAGLGLSFGEGPDLRGYAAADDESAAKRVAETLRALVTLGGNTLRQVKGQIGAGEPPHEQAMLKTFLPIAEKLLESTAIEAEGTGVTLTADAGELGDNAAVALALILPAIQQAREAARREVSRNNLKQIGLAFHNYHDTYGRFPPAVIEQNGVKRSWRVEILPYLGHQPLYDQYRSNEPWDSEHNRKVLAQMPAVFRHPAEPTGSTNTSYRVFTGPNALTDAPAAGAETAETVLLFTDKPIDMTASMGPGIGSITDGTSNTILAVEAKGGVPWTQPMDIELPSDPKELERLLKDGLGGYHEGGFNALFADGAVRFISENVDPGVFKGLVTPAGGEVIAMPGGPVPGGMPGRPAEVQPQGDPARPNGQVEPQGAVPVSGTVTLKGQPLAGATVTFFGEDGTVVTAKTDDEGRYQIDAGERDALGPGTYTPVIRGEGVPDAFTDRERSSLRVEVHEGENVFDFELQGRR